MESSVSRTTSNVGFVAIGRNEGDRLKRALQAIQRLHPQAPLVYTDSGSTDDSVRFAETIGVQVVRLDMSIPFTAARARNAGFSALIASNPNLRFVQFLDGDCEIQPGWIDTATAFLEAHENVAVVSGRRKERFPEATLFNELMDIEWNTAVGETTAVLGDMCVKVDAFKRVGGFDESIIAAEDDDLCLRIGALGYTVHRLDALMSLHDANMTRLSQWYRRAKRGGHGYANINHLHGQQPPQHFTKQLRSTILWGGIVPALFLISLPFAPLVSLALAAVYALFVLRTFWRRLRLGDPVKRAALYSFLIYTSKVPEFMGVLHYWKNHLFSRQHELIEYK